jgi:hypothetical protein
MKMTWEKGNFALSLASLIAGVCLGVWAVQSGWEIARKSGSLDQPDLRVYIAGTPLSQERSTRLLIGAPFEEGKISLVTLPIALANVGKKTATNVNLVVRYPLLLRQNLHEFLRADLVTINPHAKPITSHATLGNFEFVSYGVSAMNPSSGATIDDLIPLGSTRVEDTAETADHVKIDYTVDLSWSLLFTVQATDQAPINYELEISALRMAQAEQLAHSAEVFLEREISQYRQDHSRLQYIRLLLADRSTTSWQLAFVPLRKVSVPGVGYYLIGSLRPGSLTTATARKYLWSRL